MQYIAIKEDVASELTINKLSTACVLVIAPNYSDFGERFNKK